MTGSSHLFRLRIGYRQLVRRAAGRTRRGVNSNKILPGRAVGTFDVEGRHDIRAYWRSLNHLIVQLQLDIRTGVVGQVNDNGAGGGKPEVIIVIVRDAGVRARAAERAVSGGWCVVVLLLHRPGETGNNDGQKYRAGGGGGRWERGVGRCEGRSWSWRIGRCGSGSNPIGIGQDPNVVE